MARDKYLELYILCEVEQMNGLLEEMKKAARGPWIYWETDYQSEEVGTSYNFARFNFDNKKGIIERANAEYLGQVRFMKMTKEKVLRLYDTFFQNDGIDLKRNDYLVQDFYDTIAKPICDAKGLEIELCRTPWLEWRKQKGY